MNKIYRILTIIMLVLGTSSFVNAQTTYYSQPGTISTLANWWTAPGGTGTHPANFTTSGDIFIVQAGCTCTGTIIMGSGTNLTIDGTWNPANGIVGNIIISAAGLLNANTTLNVLNNWTNSGTFSVSTIYIQLNFNGTTDQTITTGGIGSGKTISYLSINKSGGSAILNGSLKITYLLTIVTGTFNAAGYDMYFTGTYSNSGTFLHGNNTIYLIGTIGTSISTNGTGYGKCFYNVISDKTTSTTIFTGISEIAHDLTITSGYFQIGNSSTLFLGGNYINNGIYYPAINFGTLAFNGTGNQNITTGGTGSSKRFWDINIDKTAGTVYLIGDMYVINNFTITNGSFDVSTYNMTVRGSWSNSGSFVPHSQTVTFIANNNISTINGGGNGAGKAFYNVTFNHAGYRKNLSGDIQINGNLLGSNGTLNAGMGSYNIYCYGNITFNDSFQPGNSTVHMMGTATQTIIAYRSYERKFYNLTINKSSGTVNLGNHTEARHDITLTAGTLDATTSNFSIYVGGSWINNGGIFNARAATVFFNNSASANITGTDTSLFYRITVANTYPLIVSSNTTVTNQLTITTASYLEVNPNITLVVQGTLANSNTTNNNLIIRSTASGSGSLINSTTGQHATVERFVTGGAVGSTPPIPAIKHYVSTAITGLQGYILNDPTLGNYNVYTFYNVWERIFGTTALLNGRGYLVNYNADRTIPFAGIMNTATINTTIYPTDGTFTLVGNPYPFAIDCNEFMNNATNAANIYDGLYFWNQTTANDDDDYAWWSQTWGSGGGNAGVTPLGYIASGQGFMVANYQTSGSIQFTHDMNVAGNNNQFFIVEPSPLSRLSLNVVNPYGSHNEILVGFTNLATSGFDRKYDILKLKGNPDLALYTMMYDNNKDYVAQGLPPVTDREIIPVGLDAGIAGNYTFNLGELVDFDEDVDIYLKDLQQQNTIDLRQTPAYSFYTEAGNIRDRFIIVFKNRNAPNDIPALNNEEVFIYSSAKTIHLTKTDISYLKGDLMVTDLMGRNVYTGKISGLQNYELKLDQPAGCYVVSLKDGGKVWVKKVWME